MTWFKVVLTVVHMIALTHSLVRVVSDKKEERVVGCIAALLSMLILVGIWNWL